MVEKKFDFDNSTLAICAVALFSCAINTLIFYLVYILYPNYYLVFFLLLGYYYLCTNSPDCMNSMVGGLVFFLTAYLGVFGLIEPLVSLFVLVPSTYFLWGLFYSMIKRYIIKKQNQLLKSK